MKPTQAILKRVSRHALSTKKTNKGYYKGTGTGSMGSHTKHGGYVIDWNKVRTYVVPNNLKDFKVHLQIFSRLVHRLLTDMKLTPFVTRNMQPVKGRFEGDPKGAISGEAYLARWKTENGED